MMRMKLGINKTTCDVPNRPSSTLAPIGGEGRGEGRVANAKRLLFTRTKQPTP